jgi:hypothetical protein
VALLAENPSRSAAGAAIPAKRSSLLPQFAQRFLIFYIFLSNWIWLDDLIVNPTRPFRPIFNFVFGHLTRWTAFHVLHLSGPLVGPSALDSRYTYVLLLVLAVTAFACALVWTVVEPSGRSTRPAYALFRVWVRYTLAIMLMNYAVPKIFRMQFPEPGLRRLSENYGVSSPMALLWTYVGYSAPLEIFSGFAETAGAFFLLFRRTTPLGALICVVMMSNVALMDFSYDVSVKMLAVHFLAMCVFLLAHDSKRLLSVLALNRPAPARDLDADALPISGARLKPAVRVLKYLIVLYVMVPVFLRGYAGSRRAQVYAAGIHFHGLYEITRLSIDGVDRPLLATDDGLWRRVIIDNQSETDIEGMNNQIVKYDSSYDAARNCLHLASQKGAPSAAALTVAPAAQAQGELLLTGTAGKDHVSAVLRPIDMSKFLLVSRGYHWINESSFSR